MQQPQETAEVICQSAEELALLPPGLYALVAFTRWEPPHDGSESINTFDMEWAEALQDGSAIVVPNLTPAALPGVFNGFSAAMEMGAAIVGVSMESEESYDQFASLVGLQVMTMESLARYQANGGSHVKH